ncbi:ROK family protein [Nonomuraea sp. 3N208]|uniref:ROK family protein n=1 Tax=Nonomuraea sp. 3N208 TaxID=3457421 RepID=UPI003FCC4754
MTHETPGALLSILRDGQARTRAELVQLTGLARSTLSQRLDALLDQRWILPVEEAISSGGRPATAFAFNPRARLVLAADLGVTHAHVALTDLSGTLLAEQAADLPIDSGPERCLTWLLDTAAGLLTDRDITDIGGIGLGLPGPVEHKSGRPINPPLMPGWDGFPVLEWLNGKINAPVLIDNDVNIMALGEHRATAPDVEHMIFVKVGTGIGCGIISERRLHRGAQGAAGDIGHVRVPSADQALCRCGNIGCLEAIAGGGALAARLRVEGTRDVVRLVRGGSIEAIKLVRESGREVGLVLASIVNFFNPTTIVIGGDLAEAGEHLLAGVREVVYGRSLPLATQRLDIRASSLGDRAGVRGAAMMVIEHVLTPAAVDRVVDFS